MSTHVLIVRYPDGATGLLRSDATPQEGDELRNNGDAWIVDELLEDEDGKTVVRLRRLPTPTEGDGDD